VTSALTKTIPVKIMSVQVLPIPSFFDTRIPALIEIYRNNILEIKITNMLLFIE